MEDLTNLFTGIGTLTLTAALRGAAILLVGVIAIRILLRVLDRVSEKSKTLQPIRRHIHGFFKTLLYVLLVLVVLDSLGIHVTSFVALLSVAGLAASLALQNALSNVAGGIILLTTKPFSIGDWISLGATDGRVKAIGLSYSVLVTKDNKEVYVPNSELSSQTIVNFTRLGSRRLDLTFGASYDAPTETVKAALREAVDSIPQIDRSRAPEYHIDSYGESAIEYIVCVYVAPGDYLAVRYALLEAVRETFAAHGVEIPYNHLNVHLMKE